MNIKQNATKLIIQYNINIIVSAHILKINRIILDLDGFMFGIMIFVALCNTGPIFVTSNGKYPNHSRVTHNNWPKHLLEYLNVILYLPDKWPSGGLVVE